jgi:hypothetical protein
MNTPRGRDRGLPIRFVEWSGFFGVARLPGVARGGRVATRQPRVLMGRPDEAVELDFMKHGGKDIQDSSTACLDSTQGKGPACFRDAQREIGPSCHSEQSEPQSAMKISRSSMLTIPLRSTSPVSSDVA